MTPVFKGNFIGGEFKLQAGEREKFVQYCRGQKNGEARMTVKRARWRSMPYHRYFFGVIVNMCAQHFQAPQTGMYQMLMQQFRPLVTDDGQLTYAGVSKLDTKEMIELGEEIREYMYHTHGLRIPEPNEVELQDVHELQSRYA